MIKYTVNIININEYSNNKIPVEVTNLKYTTFMGIFDTIINALNMQ